MIYFKYELSIPKTVEAHTHTHKPRKTRTCKQNITSPNLHGLSSNIPQNKPAGILIWVNYAYVEVGWRYARHKWYAIIFQYAEPYVFFFPEDPLHLVAVLRIITCTKLEWHSETGREASW